MWDYPHALTKGFVRTKGEKEDRTMASEYEWLDRYDISCRTLNSNDVAWGWAVYVLLLICLVVPNAL